MQTIKDNESIGQEPKSVGIGLVGLLSCRLQLAPGEVHVWQARLEERLAANVERYLSADEISRASRFHFAKDRNNFVAARGLLRTLLSAYLEIGAAELEFSYGAKGKPSVKQSQVGPIHFNLAHSHDMAIYAFASDREIGVDLEYIREDLADEKIARRFFSSHEIKTLEGLPTELKKEAFFNCWTRKEAYIKARGEGILMALDEFDVSLRPGEPAALLVNHKDAAETTRWTMRSVSVPSDYLAALVVEGDSWEMKSFVLE